MLYRSAVRRPGVTLLEVLTAIFIMAIGMLALLTLFPAGALSMARAVRDDRAATIAANGSATAAAIGLRNDSNVTSAITAAAPHPVLVDPHYANISAGNVGAYVLGATNSPGITRVIPSLVRNSAGSYEGHLVAQFFVCQDEIEFDPLGSPGPTLGVVRRPGTYTLAHLVRRSPAKTSVDQSLGSRVDLSEVTTVVFARRNLDLPEGETTLAAGQNNVTSVSGAIGATTIDINYSGTPPEIRRRSWLLDVTLNPTTGSINGFFYRVENVTDTPGAAAGTGTLTVELDRALKGVNSATETVQAVVHFRDVIAAVERGTTWQP